jgi:hypothetical protein
MRKLVQVIVLTVGVIGLALGQPGGRNGNHSNNSHNNGRNDNNGNGSWRWNDGPNKAPEINPSQAAGALALLSGAMLIVRRKK